MRISIDLRTEDETPETLALVARLLGATPEALSPEVVVEEAAPPADAVTKVIKAKRRKRRTKAELAAASSGNPAEVKEEVVVEKEEAAPVPTEAEVKEVVIATCKRLTDSGADNATNLVVDVMVATTNKKRVGEIEKEDYAAVINALNAVTYTPPAPTADKLF